MLTAGIVMAIVIVLCLVVEASRRHCRVCVREFGIWPSRQCWACWRAYRTEITRIRRVLRDPGHHRHRGS